MRARTFTASWSAGEPLHRRVASYAWALLLAWIDDQRKRLRDETFQFSCPKCGGEMSIIAFITEAVAMRDVLAHLGEPTCHLAWRRLMASRCGRCPMPGGAGSTYRPNRRRTTTSICASPGDAKIRRSDFARDGATCACDSGYFVGSPRHIVRIDDACQARRCSEGAVKFPILAQHTTTCALTFRTVGYRARIIREELNGLPGESGIPVEQYPTQWLAIVATDVLFDSIGERAGLVGNGSADPSAGACAV